MIKKIRILFILMTFFLGVNVVNADSKCEEMEFKAVPYQFVYADKMLYSHYTNGNKTGKAGIILYNFKVNGKTSVGYCRNAGIAALNGLKDGNVNIRKNYTLKCVNTLFDRTEKAETKTEEAKFAYEKGVIKLLEEAQKKGGIEIGINEFSELNIALRTYEMFWPNFNSNEELTITNDKYDVMKYYANLWLDDEIIKSKINEIKRIAGNEFISTEKFNTQVKVNSLKDYRGNILISKENFEKEIKNYVIKALDAAIDYLKNGSALINWNKEGLKSGPSIKTIDGKKYYTVSYTHKFEIEKFVSSQASIKINLECSNCTRNGIEYKIYIKGENDTEFKEVSGNLSNLEILNYVKNGTGKVDIKIDFKKLVDEKECNDNVSYKLNVEYYDDTIDTEAYNIKDPVCDERNQKCQYFYVLFSENVKKTDSADQKIELCVEDTTACSSYIKNDTCESGKTNLNISINEGYEIDVTNDCKDETQEITSDKLNVLQCIANDKAKDDAGNSYKVTAGETYKNVANNAYCSVYCMEDYQFTLPGMKAVKSGRYFTLEASVKGTKKCYTNEINNDKFETDLEKARLELIIAYNDYQYWLAAASTEYDHDSGKETAPGKECTSCCNPGPGDTCSPNGCSGGDTTEWEYWKKTWTYTTYDLYGNKYTGKESYSSGGTSSCGSCSCQPDNIGEEQIVNGMNHQQLADYAKELLDKAIQNYENVINEYNSCFGSNVTNYTGNTLKETITDGWKINYNYNPTINFWYPEKYMNDVLTNELKPVGEGNKNFSTITEKHYLSNNGKVPTNEITSSKIYTLSQFICYKRNEVYVCDYAYLSTGKAKYVTQEMTVNASYITPTQFYSIYPPGAIAVSDGTKTIENSSALPNGLPIGLGTEQGVYNYVLKVKDLGEYYNNTDKLGRIWGDSESVVVDVLKDVEQNKSCSKKGALTIDKSVQDYGYDATYKNGVYVCGITVNSPVCDPNDPNSEGYNNNWQADGWEDACTPNEKCNPNDPTSPGYNQNWKIQGWKDGCTKRNIVVSRKCNPNNPSSKGYNKNWQEDGWKDGCTPKDPCPAGKCPIVCDPVCKWDPCSENNCPVVCEKCIFTNNQTNISTRPITPSDINPNDRELGVNWQFDENNLETSLELKAYVTTTEIVTDGESIYENGANVNNDYTMEINLDSSLINKIREYSKQHEDTGGYATNTLKCYDYTGKDGNKYDNVFCYSTFIDELIYEGYEDNFSGIENRVIGRDAADSDNLRKEETQKSGYWTTWDEATWNVTTTIGVNPQQNYKGLGIGPSWK